ncbi:hemolysin family protein [Parabacteroides sp. Marseille-P3160]|uniref:hemolysin family protein n=1 Tax=Parabacteroides sp. Marseille-P3160 TaxID=1917887 RepID=UPI0009BBA02B|nr:hemolysin family protein [Parabacteroides sp. Marseille-P3160]
MELLINIIVLLLVSGFFAGIEAAFISSGKLEYQLNREEKNLLYRILDRFYRNPDQFILIMRIGECISLATYSVYLLFVFQSSMVTHEGAEFWLLLLKILIATFIWLFLGKFVPQMICRLNPNQVLLISAIPLFFVSLLLFPLSKLFSFVSWGILRLSGVKNPPVSIRHSFSRTDLDSFIQQGIDENSNYSDINTEVKIFQNALDFSNVRVRDCAVPRTEIVAAGLTASIDELRSKFIETGLSKIVIYNNNIDNIVGYIHSSEMFKHYDDWKQHLRKVSIVPETMAANKLMKRLMQEKKSIAVVVDEFGGTTGIVTLEDLVEEIFGEIEDEHDTRSYIARKVGEGEYLLSGRIEIDYLNETFGLDLEESDDYLTIAGYILHYYQSFPKLNETIVIGKYTFKILKVTATKIELVHMLISKE